MEHKHSGADVGRRRGTALSVHTRNVLSDTWNRSNDDSVRHKHSNLHDRSTLQYGTLSHERPIRMASISERDIPTGQPPSTSSMHASRHTPLSHDRVLRLLSTPKNERANRSVPHIRTMHSAAAYMHTYEEHAGHITLDERATPVHASFRPRTPRQSVLCSSGVESTPVPRLQRHHCIPNYQW